jgi:hypothetical protein
MEESKGNHYPQKPWNRKVVPISMRFPLDARCSRALADVLTLFGQSKQCLLSLITTRGGIFFPNRRRLPVVRTTVYLFRLPLVSHHLQWAFAVLETYCPAFRRATLIIQII